MVLPMYERTLHYLVRIVLLVASVSDRGLIFVMPIFPFVRPRPQFLNGHTHSVGVLLKGDVTSFVFILAESPRAKSGILIRELLDTTTQRNLPLGSMPFVR